MSAQKLKLLFVSNLFPDSGNPNRGSDNAVLLRLLERWCDIRVIAPRPTLPFSSNTTFHACLEDKPFAPVYPMVRYVPKIGGPVNHLLMAAGLRKAIIQVRKEFAFDIVLCSWVYPDACAVGKLSQELGFKFVAIAQGTDIHQYLRMPTRRRIIQKYLPRAEAVITRSARLATMLEQIGFDKNKLRVVYNGVDFRIFHPSDKVAARRDLKLPENTSILLFVGNFVAIKNPTMLLAAYRELCRQNPKQTFLLVMLGSGPLENTIRKTADFIGCPVLLPGRKAPAEVARYMQASDLLCLSSLNEGLPNVILEALACGLRVVSTNVGGISELLGDPALGRMVDTPFPLDFQKAISAVLSEPLEEDKLLATVSRFSWDKAANTYMELLRS